MTVTLNASFDPGSVSPASDVAVDFHRGLRDYAPTPLRAAPRVAAELGFERLDVKDETDRLGLPAFKALGASWAVDRALAREPAARTVVAASAGNHGRAVARFAAERGLACRIYLPRRSGQMRRDAISAEGAEAVVVDGDYEEAVRLAADAGAEPGFVEIADVGESDSARDVIDGYATLFSELDAQLEPPLDVLLVPVGVGSLAAAAVRWAVPRSARVVAVEPESAACLAASLERGSPVRIETSGTSMAGMDCAEVSRSAWPDLQAGVSAVIAVADDELARAAVGLRDIGIEPGECSAAVLAAARTLASDGAAPMRMALSLPRTLRVLALATEGPTAGAIT